LKSVGNDISSTNSEAIWQIIEEKTIFEEKKSHSKFEITENGNEILHSLFTPSRNFVRILNSTTEKVTT
jgi:predicted transcriptional regulator